MLAWKKPICSICGNKKLELVISLPDLPFTGIYLSKKDKLSKEQKFHGVDQGLNLCQECGHAQLDVIVNPNIVYDETYTHRGSISPIASQGNEFFVQFLKKIAGTRSFNLAIDIGCNDGYLLSLMKDHASELIGIDPIWKDKKTPIRDGIKFFGAFVEEINTFDLVGKRPDLIVSAHTFEHIENPKEQLEKLVKEADEQALFLIEVPSFETLVKNHRFDQIFHQHIQYYSRASFNRLIKELGCELIDYAFNYKMWGGTMLVAFQKTTSSPSTSFHKYTKTEIEQSYQLFRQSLENLKTSIQNLRGEEVYGFGAAQMFPILAYHLGSDLDFIKCIYDDNQERINHYYPYLNIEIKKPDLDKLKDQNILITALDSIRPIVRRLDPFAPKKIYIPLSIV